MAVTAKNVRFLTGLWALPKHAFDDVIARSMASRNVAAVFDLSKIIDGKTRRHALSHYAEVLKFARKFGFPCAIASGASSWIGQRSVSEVVALCSLFGMGRTEVYHALEIDEVLFPAEPVEVVE
jgi:RNase P/RNase MRP subunit p30